MAKLRTLKPRLATASASRVKTLTTAERRMTGSALQGRRYRKWLSDPHCAGCGRVTSYPSGFELDHIIPLHQGGKDSEANCQVLCVHVEVVDGRRVKTGCHVAKSASDLRYGV